MVLNFSVNKTNISVSLLGPGSRSLYKEILKVDKPVFKVHCVSYGVVDVPFIHGYKHVGSVEGQGMSYQQEIACRRVAANLAIKSLNTWFASNLPQKGKVSLLYAFVLSVLFMNLASSSNTCSFEKLESTYSKCIRLAVKSNKKDAPLNVSNLIHLGYSGLFLLII